MSQFHKGDTVQWNWGQSQAEGEVQEIHQQRVTMTIKGARITRNASADNPAYTIAQADGDKVLKSETELQPV